MVQNPKQLLTFGYEGLDIVAFIERLRTAGVHSVVDVRELPLSRKKGFSKTALCEHLKKAGIAYLHVPALGCPRPIRNRYRADGDWDTYSRDFMAYLETQRDTLLELAKIARATTACLICYEADFERCHRTYVARAAHRLGGPAVGHLTTRTETIPDRPLRLVA
ncbi:MAG: DUF488 domain-containing protein [Thiobacillus sp.]|nr:DUF488 domain-containing protein [Thiobacillus sp.]